MSGTNATITAEMQNSILDLGLKDALLDAYHETDRAWVQYSELNNVEKSLIFFVLFDTGNSVLAYQAVKDAQVSNELKKVLNAVLDVIYA